VIVPAHTYIATWLAVRMAGATPRPVDVDPVTRNLAAESVASAMTERTRAIIPVHLYGVPVDTGPLMRLAADRALIVIEDAAQAHGASLGARRIGGTAHSAAWSFYPGKNLGAFGDAGAITTDDESVAVAARTFRNYGAASKYVHETVGVNSRLDPLQAAFLRVKLARLDRWNQRRRHLASIYLRALADVPGLTLPTIPPRTDPVWHLFVIEHADRAALQEALTKAGIGTLIHYPTPPHLSRACADLGFPSGSFPIAERLAATVLSLPIGPHLTDGEAQAVVDAVREAAAGCGR
jgi:dTDP-4-amino-4,6-dideoxygalactose transaminase